MGLSIKKERIAATDPSNRRAPPLKKRASDVTDISSGSEGTDGLTPEELKLFEALKVSSDHVRVVDLLVNAPELLVGKEAQG
jgi:hypothetical protein